MGKYLDYGGLSYFWGRLKEYFVKKGSSTRTEGHVVIWGDDNYTIEDSGYTIAKSVPANAAFTDHTYTPASANPLMDGTVNIGSSDKYAREDHRHPSDTTKVDKVTGKGLSTNDFTDNYKMISDSINSLLTGDTTFDGTLLTSTLIAGGESVIHYGVCGEAAGNANKTVSLANGGAFLLVTGAWIAVKFTNGNSATAADLTLNVAGTGNIPIKYRNSVLLTPGQIRANGTYFFVYDGTNWQVIGDFDTDTSLTTYGSVVDATGNITGHAFGYDHMLGFRAGSNVTLTPTAASASGYSGEYYLKIDAASVQSDWSVTDTNSEAYIKNKPTIPSVGNAKIFYGTCSTAANTAAKVVTCTAFVDADLTAGTTIAVLLTNGSTTDGLTLNVNGKGAKSVGLVRNGSRATSGLANVFKQTNAVYVFTYDGNNWLAHNVDTNTTYNTMTQDQATAGTDTTGRLITAKVLGDTIAAAKVGAAQFQYVIDSSVSGHAGLPTSGYKKAQYWVVKTPGTYAGEVCEAGDMIFCLNDYASAFANADFSVVQNNIETIATGEIDDIVDEQ